MEHRVKQEFCAFQQFLVFHFTIQLINDLDRTICLLKIHVLVRRSRIDGLLGKLQYIASNVVYLITLIV